MERFLANEYKTFLTPVRFFFCREKALKSWVPSKKKNKTAAIQIYSNQADEMPQHPHRGGEWQQAMALSMELSNDGNNVSQLGYTANESSGRFATEWMSQSKSQELNHDLGNTLGRDEIRDEILP